LGKADERRGRLFGAPGAYAGSDDMAEPC